MSKAEILTELPKLTTEELAEIQAKLDELVGEIWLDGGELTDTEKATLDAALAEYKKNPDAGSSWEEVEARIRSKLRLCLAEGWLSKVGALPNAQLKRILPSGVLVWPEMATK